METCYGYCKLTPGFQETVRSVVKTRFYAAYGEDASSYNESAAFDFCLYRSAPLYLLT